MNRYAQIAQQHWTRWLPERVAAMTDQQTFFETLGEDVERQIDEMATALAGEDRPGETYLEKLGRLREARMTAESDVLRETVLLPPTTDQDEQDSARAGDAPWLPTSRDRTDPDPLWQEELALLEETEQDRRQQSTQPGRDHPAT